MSITGGFFSTGGERKDTEDKKQTGGEGPDREAVAPWERIEIDLDSGVLVLPEPTPPHTDDSAESSADGDD